MGRVPDYDLEEAERRLENLAAARRNGDGATGGGIPTAEHPLESVPWMHVQEGGDTDLGDDEDDGHVPSDDVLDVFIEAYNERDLDGCLALLCDGCEVPGLEHAEDDPKAALEDLWERRPTSRLTHGRLEEQDAAVLWELGPDAAWWRIALVRLSQDANGDIDEVQFDDAPDLLDLVVAQPPEGQLDEGATWQEWEEGVADT